MTTVQMNAEMLHNLSIIATDENLLRRATKYLRKLVAEKKSDPTLMTKEDFFSKIERGEEAYKQGECHELLVGEDLTTYLKRRGYDI